VEGRAPPGAPERPQEELVLEAEFHPAPVPHAEDGQRVEPRPPRERDGRLQAGHDGLAAEDEAPARREAVVQPREQPLEVPGVVEGLEEHDPVGALPGEAPAERRQFKLDWQAERFGLRPRGPIAAGSMSTPWARRPARASTSRSCPVPQPYSSTFPPSGRSSRRRICPQLNKNSATRSGLRKLQGGRSVQGLAGAPMWDCSSRAGSYPAAPAAEGAVQRHGVVAVGFGEGVQARASRAASGWSIVRPARRWYASPSGAAPSPNGAKAASKASSEGTRLKEAGPAAITPEPPRSRSAASAMSASGPQ
jgi:hypothetical protein